MISYADDTSTQARSKLSDKEALVKLDNTAKEERLKINQDKAKT